MNKKGKNCYVLCPKGKAEELGYRVEEPEKTEETNNVLEHVLTDVIHKSVLDEIANCKLKEIDLTS